jgi:hypothetical protein
MKPKDPEKSANPKLADFLCFAIYSANLAYGRAYNPASRSSVSPIPNTSRSWRYGRKTTRPSAAWAKKMFLESNTLTPI